MKKQILERDSLTLSHANRVDGNATQSQGTAPGHASKQIVLTNSADRPTSPKRENPPPATDNSLEDLIRLFDEVARSSASPNRILERLVRDVRLALNAQCVTYFRRSDDGDYLIVEAGESRDADDTLELAQQAHPLTPDCVQVYRRFWDLITAANGPTLLDFSDPSARALLLPASVPWHDRFGARWALCCPMLVGERAVGFLGVRTDNPKGFTDSEQRAMQSLAQKLTLVITVDALNRQVAETTLLREQSLAVHRHMSELARRDRLMAAVVRFSETMARPGTLDQNLPEALHHLLDAEGISRAMVGRNETLPEGKRIHRFLYEAVLPGIPLQMHVSGANQLQLGDFQEIAARLETGEIVNHATMCEVANSEASSAILDAAKTKATLLIPVNDRGKLWGTIGFENCVDARDWTDSEVQVLRGATACVSSALAREAAEEEACRAAVQLVEERKEAAVKRASELSRINSILTESVSHLSHDDDPARVLDRLVEHVAHVVDAYHVFLFAYDPNSDTLSLQRSWLDGHLHIGMRGEELPLWAAPFPSTITPAWRQMCERRDLHTPANVVIPPEEFAWPGALEYLSKIRATDAGHMALFIGDEAVGSMGFALVGGQKLPFEDIAIVEAIGRQAAVALKLVKLANQASAAAVAKERQQAVERRTVELVRANASLSRSLTAMSRSSDFEHTIETIFNEIVATTEAAAGQLFLYEVSDNTLNTTYWIDESGSGRGACPDSPESIREPFDADITPAFRQCVDTGEIMVAEHATMPAEVSKITWPGVIDWHLNRNRASSCAVPIMIGSRPLGMIGLAWSCSFRFAPEQRELLIALTNQIALVLQLRELAHTQRVAAISREREFAAERRAADLADTNMVLKRTLDAVVSEPELDNVLGQVLVAIAEYLRSPASAVWLADGDSGRFNARLAYHEGRVVEISEATKGILKGKWGRGRDLYFKDHMRLRKPVVYQVEELREPDPRAYAFFRQQGIHTLLGIPLLLGEEIVGSLTVRFDTPRQLQAEDLELSQAMAHQATMAVQLTRLAERAEHAAVLGERTRLAREIHDTVAQGLVAILMHTRAAALGDDLEQHLKVIERLAEENLAEARLSVRALRPTDAGQDGLVGRLRRLSEKLTASAKTTVRFTSHGQYSPLPNAVEDEIGRIAQEAATNASKHSQAAEVNLELIWQAEGLMLTISDTGRGFDTERLPAGRYGIVGMIERAERIGAAFTIISEPGRGTSIVVRWQPGHSFRERK